MAIVDALQRWRERSDYMFFYDLDEYLVSRIAEWCSPRHRLDERFVELGLLVDRGETATTLSTITSRT
jgi:hypothetical protein